MKPISSRKTSAVYALAIAVLTGCGGGGGDSASTAAACTGTACTSTQTSLSQAASATTSTTPSTTLCGVDVGAKLLEGSVTAAHDGDTITLSSGGTDYKIRLDSIDAPELAQPFGNASKSSLASAVLGKRVRVAYTKTDPYDRIVGAVFTDSCQYVNLNQVSSGMAWFYKAYQCEVSAAVRLKFLQAQGSAAAADLGLWAQVDPEAPWFFRNGFEPVTPVCTADPNGATPVAVSTVTTTSTAICYTGPRGGTYTLNANGSKNYSGC